MQTVVTTVTVEVNNVVGVYFQDIEACIVVHIIKSDFVTGIVDLFNRDMGIHQFVTVVALQRHIGEVEGRIAERFVEDHIELGEHGVDSLFRKTFNADHLEEVGLQTEGDIVSGRSNYANGVNQMQTVHIDRIRLLRQVDEREPYIGQRNLLIVVADTADNFIVAIARIVGTDIVPTNCRRSNNHVYHRVIIRQWNIDGVVSSQHHSGTATLREVERVGIVVNIGFIIDQEVVASIGQVTVSSNRVQQLVSPQTGDQAQLRITIGVVVDNVGRDGSELTKQGAGEEPLCRCGCLAGNVSQVDVGQTQSHLVTILQRANHVEVDSQTVFILGNLGLHRFHSDIGSRTVANIREAHCQSSRLAGFHLVGGQSVVTKDVALQEVVDLQVGRRIDRNVNRHEVVGDRLACSEVEIAEATAEVVDHRLSRSSTTLGDEAHLDGGLIVLDNSTTGDVVDIVKRECVNLEEIALVDTLSILHNEVSHNLSHVGVGTVEDGQRTVECLAGHCHTLRELHRHLGTNRAVRSSQKYGVNPVNRVEIHLVGAQEAMVVHVVDRGSDFTQFRTVKFNEAVV